LFALITKETSIAETNIRKNVYYCNQCPFVLAEGVTDLLLCINLKVNHTAVNFHECLNGLFGG